MTNLLSILSLVLFGFSSSAFAATPRCGGMVGDWYPPSDSRTSSAEPSPSPKHSEMLAGVRDGGGAPTFQLVLWEEREADLNALDEEIVSEGYIYDSFSVEWRNEKGVQHFSAVFWYANSRAEECDGIRVEGAMNRPDVRRLIDSLVRVSSVDE